jgi:hypothetical protein
VLLHGSISVTFQEEISNVAERKLTQVGRDPRPGGPEALCAMLYNVSVDVGGDVSIHVMIEWHFLGL